MGYSGGNISPPLAWQDPPEGTRSFAITLYDPDAPTGSGWWHWVVINIPATVSSLPAGAGSGDNNLPEPAEMTRTDFGGNVYGGAAPPPGPEHHYIFTIMRWTSNGSSCPATPPAPWWVSSSTSIRSGPPR